MEWFHDHVRIDTLRIEGAIQPERDMLRPDRTRHGTGLELKEQDAAPYQMSRAAPADGLGDRPVSRQRSAEGSEEHGDNDRIRAE